MSTRNDPEPMDFFNALTKAACEHLKDEEAKRAAKRKAEIDEYNAALKAGTYVQRPDPKYPYKPGKPSLAMYYPPGGGE